jgi:hypothetical protein
MIAPFQLPKATRLPLFLGSVSVEDVLLFNQVLTTSWLFCPEIDFR